MKIACVLVVSAVLAVALGQERGFLCKREGSRCTVGRNECCNMLRCQSQNGRRATCQSPCGDIQCQDEGDSCVIGVTNCCRGLSCERRTIGNGFACRRSSIGGDCQASGELCRPGITKCCGLLTCKRKLMGNGYICRI